MATLKDSAYNAPAALTITLASLANSTAGVGQQSTEVDNTTTRFARIRISVQIKLGTTPTLNAALYAYLIRNSNAATPIRDDNAGAADAAITIKNAQLVATLTTGPSAATGDTLYDNFLMYDIGPKWALAIVNSSGAALDATAANHVVTFDGMTDDIA